MYRDFKENLKRNSRLQPYLYLVKHALDIFFNKKVFPKSSVRSSDFIFIVGCGRSGNTLLRRLLIEQFSIYIPPETYVLTRQINSYRFCTPLLWPDKVDSVISILENHPEFETFGVDSLAPFKFEAKRWPKEKQYFDELIVGLYKWLGERNNISAKWVGDKTPLNTLNLGMIHLAFPNAKFIFMERDPVDVVQSYLEAGIYTTADSAAKRWLDSLASWQSFKRHKPSSDILELRYEDLVSNPDVVLDRIASTFCIPKRNDEKSLAPTYLGDVSKRKHHSNVRNAPSVTSIGKGRKSISTKDLNAARKVLGHLPQSRGYKEL